MASQSSSSVQLPLEPLLVLLRSKGFRPKPDDYVEFLKVIEEFGSEDMDKVATLICPLIATNEQEQIKFYKVFDAYKQINQEKKLQAPRDKSKWYYFLLAFLVLGICGWLLILLGKPNVVLVAQMNAVGKVAVGDTVIFDAFPSFANLGNFADTVKISASWNFGNGWTDEGKLKTKHVFDHEGRQLVVLKIESNHFKIRAKLDSQYIHACSEIRGISIYPDSNVTIRKGNEVNFAAGFIDKKHAPGKYAWSVLKDDIKILDTAVTEFKYKFDSVGKYLVKFVATTHSGPSPCDETKEITVEVTDEKVFSLRIIQSGNEIESGTRPNPYLSWLLLVPGIAGLVGSLWHRYQQRRKEKSAAESGTSAGASQSAFKPPYEIPFENNDSRLVYCERGFREVMRSLRQKTEDEIMVLNVRQTIRNTIRTGGYPEAMFTPKLKPQEYLVLIDRSNPKSMMVGLFDFMVRSWKEENIAVERYYYTRGFKSLYNDSYPAGISLRRLSEIHKNFVLIILGSGHELVYSAYPVIDKDLFEEFNEWEHKAILTPISYPDWGEKEKVIGSYYLLLPADLDGQVPLVSALKERIYNQLPYLNSTADRFYEVDWYNFNSVKEIKEYLQQDEVFFQWLCMTAVFPKLRWEFFIEAGKAILEKYGQPEKLNFSNLLKLCRIKWMNEGVFPENTRLELLKELKVENEVIARETLLKMYDYADQFYKDDFFFREEKDLQQITSQFVLYVHDTDHYASYKERADQFQQLWHKNQVPDGPFRLYIDKKPGDKWVTPVDNNLGKTINEVFKQKDESEKKQNRSRKVITNIIAGFSVLLLTLWGILHLSWNNIQSSVPENWLDRLAVADSSVEKYISYTVDTNLYCNDSVSGKISPSEIITTLVNAQGKELATFGVDDWVPMPVDSTLASTLTAIISWDGGQKQSAQTFNPSKKEIFFRIENCADTSSNQISDAIKPIRPDSCSNAVSVALPSSLSEIWSGNLNSRLLTMDIRRRLVYYSTGDKRTYGNYRLEEVCFMGDSYKLVLSGNGQYRIFFLTNIRTNSFQLAVCPDFYPNRGEVDKVSQACGNFETMQWYYENRASAAGYVPWNGTNYTPGNLSYLQNNIANASTDNSVEVIVSVNSLLYAGPQQLNNRMNMIRKSFPVRLGNRETNWNRKNFSGTPFDRDFIVIQTKPIQTYDQQQNQNATSQLGTITLSPNPDQGSRQLIDRVGKYLTGYRNSKVILEADYSSAREQKDLQQKLITIRNMLMKAGASNRQVDTNLINAAQQQNQTNRNAPSQRTEVRIIGVNFPEDFSRPEKGY